MHQSDTSETAPEPERHGDGPPPRLHPRKGRPAALRSTRARSASQRAGAANEVVPKRITVDRATSAEGTNPPEPSKNGHVDAAVRPDGGGAPSTGGQMQPAIFGPVEGGIIVPSSEQFALMRAEAKAAGKLKDLRKLAAAWQAVAEKCDLAFEELFRLAVFRLEVERDLGAQLAQTVSLGRPKKRSPRGTISESGLPEGVSKKQSAAYQQLAAISQDQFRDYLEAARADRRTPSLRGARAYASARGPRARRVSRPKKAPAGLVVLSQELIDACVRCLGDIDMLGGQAKVKATATFADLGDLTKTTQGKLLVVGASDPAGSVRRVVELRESGRIEEAIVALPRDIDATWWSSLSTGPWSLCVPNERGSPIVAHIGGHARGFSLVFASIGVVAEVQHRFGGEARE
jgi:hypothetical protein